MHFRPRRGLHKEMRVPAYKFVKKEGVWDNE